MSARPFPGEGFAFHALTELPAPPRDAVEGTTAGRLTTALRASHADLVGRGPDAAVVTAWIRVPGSPATHVVVGGRPWFPPAVGGAVMPGGDRAVLFPVGARGRDLPESELTGMLARLPYWDPCRSHPDPLWAAAPGQSDPAPRRGTFDRFGIHLAEPFAWLVVATPVPASEVDPELDRLVTEILPLTRSEIGESARVELERKQARHRELTRARSAGAWRVRVVVGAAEPARATSLAAMLCAACDLDGLPHAFTPSGTPMSLTEALAADRPGPDGAPAAVLAGPDLLAALARPPDRELPGIRMVEPRRFDVTPEGVPGDLALGDILEESGGVAGSLTLTLDALTRHTFVCGATGAGKSQTVRHLLTEASAAGVPWLVIEPAKAEYAAMAGRLAGLATDVVVLHPGDPDGPPVGLNPLEPAPGFALQTHVDMLAALFLAAFESHEPFPQILDAALVRCYEEAGWDLTLSEPAGSRQGVRYPTLTDLQRVAEQVVAEIGYGPELAADVGGFIKVRLDSLRLGTTGRFFEGGHRLDFTRLRERNVVLEIEDVGDDTDKAFLMGAVLLRLTQTLRVAARGGTSGTLAHLTVIEEAHRLLRRPPAGATGPAAHAVETFASMLAEVRAYGEGLVIAEQIPSKLTSDVLKNTAIKIVHRLPADDDRAAVGATMNLDEQQSRVLVSLVPGEGVVTTAGMDRPVRVRVPLSAAREARSPAPAPLDGLVTAHSPGCVEPGAALCSLRTIRTAQRLLGREPALVVWAELTVLAHLAGQPPPVPTAELLVALRAADPIVLRCATTQAVDAAVASRSSVLQPSTDPDTLAAHCTALLRAALAGTDLTAGCRDHEFATLASHYRWVEPWIVLTSDVELGAPEGRHPHSEAWERRVGTPVPGANRAEQLAFVDEHWDAALLDRAACDAVTFGRMRPSALERAVVVPVPTLSWPEQVAQALQPFQELTWPVHHLAGSSLVAVP